MAKSILRVKVVSAEALSSFKIESMTRLKGFSDSALKVEDSKKKSIDEEVKQRRSGDINNNNNNVRERAAWVPDPATGNFIPEDHIGDVDVADLREEVLKRHSLSKLKRPT